MTTVFRTSSPKWLRWVIASILAAFVLACGEQELPDTAADPERGSELFAMHCAVCHGPAGTGSMAGPPLVNEIYEPGHHSDEAFQLAVAQGVRAHHWSFGDMPPISGLNRNDVADIIAYIRDLQREAGIIPN